MGTGILVATAASHAVLPKSSRSGLFKSRIDSAVDIDASPEAVWHVLTDFASYPEWNPFLRSVKGAARVNAKLLVSAELSGSRRKFTFQTKVLVADPVRELRWRGRMIIPGLFDGEHCFIVEQTSPGHVRVYHAESFRGLMVPFLMDSILPKTLVSFGEMNAALKARVEGAAY
jgi:hypothetical protein